MAGRRLLLLGGSDCFCPRRSRDSLAMSGRLLVGGSNRCGVDLRKSPNSLLSMEGSMISSGCQYPIPSPVFGSNDPATNRTKLQHQHERDSCMKTGIDSLRTKLQHQDDRDSRNSGFKTGIDLLRTKLQHQHERNSRSSGMNTGIDLLKTKLEHQHETDSTNSGINTGIDWLSLNRKQYSAYLKVLRSSIPDFRISMLCREEQLRYMAKRSEVIAEHAEELAKVIGTTDLITPLMEARKARRRG